MQERMIALEESRELERKELATRAYVDASFEGTSPSSRLLVRNHGPAKAFDVTVEISGVPYHAHRQRVGKDPSPLKLEAGTDFPFWWAVAAGAAGKENVTVRWQDPDGTSREWESDLSVS